MIGDPPAMLKLAWLVIATVTSVRSRQRLVVENLLLRQQLQVALRSRRRPCLRARDKLFWLLVSRLNRDYRCHLLLVRPETVLGWYRRGWRLFWHWRSGLAVGRPRLNAEVRVLIATMGREQPGSPHRALGLETPVPSRRQVDVGVPGLSSTTCTTPTNEPRDSRLTFAALQVLLLRAAA
jgi:hypothetical protein